MIALALIAAASFAAPVPAATTPCVAALCDAERLRPFFDRLATARDGGEPVRILQLGDSHTAGDQITGAWRAALQARYGVGGRGMLAPGRPYQGYLTRGVTAAQSPDWSVRAIFGPNYAAASTVPLGLSGFALVAGRPGAWLSLAADTPAQEFDRLTLCGWAAPGAGAVQATLGATSITWSFDALVARPMCRSIEATAATTNAEVRVTAGSVTLTSWTVGRRAAGGVILSNLGVVGAQLTHLDREDDRLAAAEIAVARPDLIVVGFGTNEAFKPGFSASAYDAALQAGVRRIRRLAPGVPILMLGAPDSATHLTMLQNDSTGGLSSCPDGSGWAPPAGLAQVQAIQRRRARELGVAYWDWSQRMGGRCTANGWAGAAPPRMRGDRVHFTRTGGEEIARLLQQDLDAAASGSSTTPPAAPLTR